eukprot:TRINITY_DN3321_c0_g2_i2.p1 TRINITY_DN3321_c0_g2~~TRINITY_DN3321_c0_g2_i2.p1  ORF type:complete len:389 (+),score=99.40 TRINITY_DN3321_c0_g2_i2:280-1446(+)
MKRGEKARFVVDSKYAYGEKGSPPKIPPNTPLEFEIELLDFYSKRKPVMDMDVAEREALAEECKARGNESFKARKLKYAAYSYNEGIGVLRNVPEPQLTEKGRSLWISLRLNLCIVLNNSGNWSETIKHAGDVIARQEGNSKARYLRGVAKEGMKLYDEALADFEISLKGNPEDAKLKAEIEACKKKKKAVDTKEKKVFASMFKELLYDERKQGVPKYDPKNARVFMDIKTGNAEAKRVIIELFSQALPKTTDNFKALCNKAYKGAKFHTVMKEFMMIGGGGIASIYGKPFEDESFTYNHFGPGVLSMASKEKNTNESEFFITFRAIPELDGKNVVFGRVIKGMDVIREIENVKVDAKESPLEEVLIADCGKFAEDVISPENCCSHCW